MTRCLEAQSLAFAYPKGGDVFSDVLIRVQGGAMTGIVGPNGSGKSTLLRVLSGFERARAGRVLLDGRPITSYSHRERAQVVAFLPQTATPVFSLRVFEVVCLGRFPYLGALGAMRQSDKAIAERCLRDTETEDLRERDFMSLSGGERQRVLLASILAQEPSLLLLDEPTSALDIHHQAEIFSLLQRLARNGYGVCAVTHDLNLAASYCDQLLLLSRSEPKPVAVGKPEDVVTESLLSRAYGAPIRVCRHPLTGALLVSADMPQGVAP
ncbi:MAG: ABC transporter ATP-binding protein [Candidatus Hydrogenedentes bacterium]|nr:ABC transporter ATP-binding protein [Candidatus Hydrogenedentota bacterium]